MSSGNVVEIIGAVVDVEFPREDVPKVYDALKVGETGLTLEVQQQIGDGVVRTIAMGSTDGLKRGIAVDNTGAPVSVPVRVSVQVQELARVRGWGRVPVSVRVPVGGVFQPGGR